MPKLLGGVERDGLRTGTGWQLRGMVNGPLVPLSSADALALLLRLRAEQRREYDRDEERGVRFDKGEK